MTQQSESGRDRNERKDHDRKSRDYEDSTSNPYHLSKGGRLLFGIVAVIVIIAVTALFFRGFIHTT